MHWLIDRMAALAYEQVFTTSFDGLTLAGRYYEVKAGAPLAICFHGYRGSAVRDFCGGAIICMEAGYNTLVIDERGHGKSRGHTVSFGVKEKYDVISWIDYANRRFGKEQKIVLCGISMGASTVLMASALPLPENVVGITADDMRDMFEIRLRIEGEAARRAALNISDDRLRALREILDLQHFYSEKGVL